ncbi:MAG TPA: hypothetical protein VF057_04840 [Thermoanaerobaculia bacterium]
MKNPLKAMAIAAFALLIAVPGAFAQNAPEASILPVTEPLDVGGTILQPGTYTIRVLPSLTDRNKIQITNQDGSKVFATVLTVPHQLEPGEEVPNTTFVYFPASDGMPRALRTWFASDPPGRHGHDIVYEEDRAKVLARLANANVVYYPSDTEITRLDTSTLSVITPEAEVETYTFVAPTTPVETQTTRVTTIETETPSTMASQSTRVEMPATASNLPLIALLGLISLCGAVAIRLTR